MCLCSPSSINWYHLAIHLVGGETLYINATHSGEHLRAKKLYAIMKYVKKKKNLMRGNGEQLSTHGNSEVKIASRVFWQLNKLVELDCFVRSFRHQLDAVNDEFRI